ncbi:MAG: Rne/Rng family ribonuclease, partial [Novosphingobium sp.]
VLLVQVVKEERGNKGAALTTYLSLAGRYCVLMPNSSHGGGISRKINSASDRKRLKGIIAELDLPKSMGCIVRTAGLSRTKTEIKRDFDYLARLWDEIRENTLKSSAPALIHSDSDLIKRAIRDIYNRDIEEVIVEGEGGYRAARDFMKLLMPSHARRVKAYVDPVPLFQRYGAEDQLTAMYDPVVQLKSGGYIVINPTEALVSIDINSGRSTKEHGIEATALNTNLEAAREIARQLRLRDMAGLVVIDFIDMEYGSNVRKVEKAMKDALKNDRARIQVGRISSFGLMEMSRQRLRTGVLEATTRICPHCDGSGLVRTASSAGLSALRLIEDEAAKGKGIVISLYASTEASIYLLNAKRSDLAEIEARYGVRVEVLPEGEDEGAKMRVLSSGPRNDFVPRFDPIIEEDDADLPGDDFDDLDEEEAEERAERSEDGDGRRSKRRKRRRSRDRREDTAEDAEVDARDGEDSDGDEQGDDEQGESDLNEGAHDESETGEAGEAPRKRRRRGRRRRGGKDRSDGNGEFATEGTEGFDAETGVPEAAESAADSGDSPVAPLDMPVALPEAETIPAEAVAAEAVIEVVAEVVAAPAPKKRTRRKKADVEAEAAVVDTTEAAAPEPEAAPAKPKRTRRKAVQPAATEAVEVVETADNVEPVAAEPVAAAEAPAKPKRTRRKKAEPVVEADAAVAAEAPAMPEQAVAEPVPGAGPQASSDDQAAAATPEREDQPAEDTLPPRQGWWQRTFGN